MQIVALSLLLLFCLSCRPGINYADPVSPRYAGIARVVNTPTRRDTLRIVSFNIEYALETRRAAHLLSTVATLRDADLILLQEMTAPATSFLADSLHMRYVYSGDLQSPEAARHRERNSFALADYGRLEDHSPRPRYAKTQRIATVATIRVKDQNIRVYSTHVGTPADLGWKGRVEQLRGISTTHPRIQRLS